MMKALRELVDRSAWLAFLALAALPTGACSDTTGGIVASGGAGTGGTGTAGSAGAGANAASTLRAAAESTGRLFGAALNTGYLSELVYRGLASTEFNYATAEWEMKWEPTEPSANTFTYDLADRIMDFASTYDLKVKGHTLVWHYSLPDWVSNLATAEELRSAMLNHIQNVVGRYAGRIKAWDVVNEALDDAAPDGYRNSVFYQKLGETYIDEAFQAAHAADPNALLFYNEFNIEWPTSKLDATYALVQRLLAANVPIHGVGFQMHVSPEGLPSGDSLAAALGKFTDLGLWVNLSELDVRVGTLAGDLSTKFEVQRARYHDLVAVCIANPKCMSVTTWGITDDHTWLDDQNQRSWAGDGPHYPLLFNADGSKKPAYDATLAALLGDPSY